MSVRFDLPEGPAQRLLWLGRKIPRAVLVGRGRERHPHVTLYYSIQPGLPEIDLRVERLLRQIPPPLVATLGMTSFLFPLDVGEGDTVVVTVFSSDLRRLNRALRAELGCKPDGIRSEARLSNIRLRALSGFLWKIKERYVIG